MRSSPIPNFFLLFFYSEIDELRRSRYSPRHDGHIKHLPKEWKARRWVLDGVATRGSGGKIRCVVMRINLRATRILRCPSSLVRTGLYATDLDAKTVEFKPKRVRYGFYRKLTDLICP